ncbi:MAG: MBL fold metallo-hydrolase, partial [Actinobacteria bacterium]|nr:MBL fold metallo-hydrolase [Actinomycetota bacterium]
MSIDEQRTPKPATETTRARNAAVHSHLNLADRADFERASQGLLAQLEPPVINGPFGNALWDMGTYEFLNEDAPAEANPSLWRQAQINCLHGLFEVTDGIYQVRGYDISNITFVRTNTGWIVIDPLTMAETAAAARSLVDSHFGVR